jgi:hypothetical protein
MSMLRYYYSNLVILIAASIMIAASVTATTYTTTHIAYAAVSGHPLRRGAEIKAAAPIATSGNYVYVVWPSNKTTSDFEIMFKDSTDGGKTFGEKINLSNSAGIDSERPQISASASNVYVTWWERNQTMNEPVMRISNDNGKSFGPMIMLSSAAK